MNSESQNIEWKLSWKDEYLKWICGFANAQGGRIYIGKDDDGVVTGLKQTKKLLEDLPNKIRDMLGLMPHINLLQEEGKAYIEIIVERFKKDASKAGRLPDLSELSVEEFLKKLRVLSREGLTRAALVLFGKDPAEFYPNLFVKIGRFGESDVDLRFQEVCEGNLIQTHESFPRNPLIADVCYKAGYIDSWGRGVEKITDACKEAGVPAPKIFERSGGMVVELQKKLAEPKETPVKTRVKTRVKTPVKTRVKTSENIISVLRDNPDLTLAEVAMRIEKSVSAVERSVKKLREQDALKYVGPTKGGHWEVIEDN